MGKISLSNIIEGLATRSGLSREATDNFMHAFVETIEKGLQEDGIVKVKGLGTFKLQEVNDRGSVDVNTGERITIKGYRKVTFTPDSAMKEFINRPFAHFEPVELNEGYPIDEDATEPDNASEETEEQEVVTMEEPIEAPVEEPATELTTEATTETIEDAIEETTTETIEEAPVENAGEQTVEEVAPIEATEETELTETTEEIEEPIVETTIEEGVEEKVTEDEIVVDEVIKEEVVEEVIEEEVVVEETVEENSEEPIASTEQQAPIIEEAPQPKPERKKRKGGCIWLILFLMLLIGAIAYGVWAYFTPAEYYEHEDESSIVVKPNLQEELGDALSNEPKAEKAQPQEKQVVVDSVKEETEAKPTPDTSIVEQPQIVTESNTKPQVEPAKKEAPALFCAVTLTESLASKPIKDITIADTTDYTISGTLVTHQLKSGETIIQLAKKYYGDKRLWPYIVMHNQMKDYNNLAIGQKIEIPILK